MMINIQTNQIIAVENLTKTYKSTFQAIKCISVQIQESECIN